MTTTTTNLLRRQGRGEGDMRVGARDGDGDTRDTTSLEPRYVFFFYFQYFTESFPQ